MDVVFHLQDPTVSPAQRLEDEIVRAADGAASWRALFAFASRGLVDRVFANPTVLDLLSRGSCSLVLGIDAITNRATLERLQELEGIHSGLQTRVFWNRYAGTLFHPKASHFVYADGRASLIVGSGNFTPGGFAGNFEAFTVVRTGAGEAVDLTSWDEFLTRHAAQIRRIDSEALEEAAKNLIRSSTRRRREVEPEGTGLVPPGVPAPTPPSTPTAIIPSVSRRVLVAQVPRAGNRWHQLHLNEDVTNQFFGVSAGEVVLLQERHGDGTVGVQEQRPLVLSTTNMNRKIEIGARPGAAYPDAGPPIVVFVEDSAQIFEYMLLFPNEPGYDELQQLLSESETIGRGLDRTIANEEVLAQAWPACPLVV